MFIGVQGIIICNNAGFVLKSTLSPEDTSSYSENVQQCILFANHLVQAQNSEEKVEFLRIRTSKNEIMIVPDKEFILLVVQDTSLATLTENSFHHLLNKK